MTITVQVQLLLYCKYVKIVGNRRGVDNGSIQGISQMNYSPESRL